MNEITAPRVGYLERTLMEVPAGGSYRWVNGWKIADANGVDMVQPYMRTKTEARSVAKDLGIELREGA